MSQTELTPLAAMDMVFARWLAGRARSDQALVEATALLVSQARGAGHACVRVAAWSGRSVTPEHAPFPALDIWRDRLLASGVMGEETFGVRRSAFGVESRRLTDGGLSSAEKNQPNQRNAATPTPNAERRTPNVLVWDSNRLYLARYWQAEQRLAEQLRARVSGSPLPISAAAEARFSTLFPATKNGATDWQATAARCALTRRLTVVIGGPGTGKTTTVARLLALLAIDQPNLAVRIAAPTGKAAQRLRESLLQQLPSCGEIPASLRQAAQDASTVHRLLGLGMDGQPRFGAHRPLPCDVLVVDEASMLDLLLMEAVVAAVPETARLILLGDSGQLASVEAGCVLHDLTTLVDDSASNTANVWREHLVKLRINYRSQQHPGLAALAEALRSGDAIRALTVLADPAHAGVDRVESTDLTGALLPVWDDCLAAVRADGPQAALAALGRARILCALNDGPWGVDGLNRTVEFRLRAAGAEVSSTWYQGRPVLITANDDDAGLFNGDLGVAWDGAVWFDDGNGGVRAVAPASLPTHRTAWAMTVHKAQGAEFLRVAVVLPDAPHPLVSRELIYTAVTRARERVRLAVSVGALTAACATTAARESGLAERMG